MFLVKMSSMSNLIGEVINGYEIIEELARGGMATVYRAHQISMSRDVALKVLPREFLHEPAFLERFKREAAIVARLEHRAIVPVHDYGEWDGIPYIVMRLMEGGSVDGLILKGAIALEQVQQIVRQVAAALDYAHSHDVLHRDLKPSNILLDRNGDAFITDFGIARLLSNNEKLTSTGVVGTPAYMSPEQAQGQELDGRSDVYSLGVVVYEMLTGKRPFDAETPYGIAVMHVTQEPPPLRKLKPDIPSGVEAVVMKALIKDPTQRYRNAIEFAGHLDDADLFTLEATSPSNHHPQPTIASTPPPVISPSNGVPDSSTQPTPRRPITPVEYSSLNAIPVGQSRRSPTMMYIGMPTVIAILIGVILLGGYLILYEAEPAESPDFAATGVFRLTATASAASGIPVREGRVLFVSGRGEQPDLYILDLTTGNETRLTHTNGAEGNPSISPNGQWITYLYDPDGDLADESTSQVEIYISRTDGTQAQPITSDLTEEKSPIWTPDSQSVVYIQWISGVARYRIMRYDLETKEASLLYEQNGYADNLSISPNGQTLVFAVGDTTNKALWEIVKLELGTRETTALTENETPDWSPKWDSRGDHILYLKKGMAGGALAEIQPDGSDPTQLYDGAGLDDTASYSLDGNFILFSATDDDGIQNIFLLQRNRLIAEQITHMGGYSAVWIP